MEIIHSIIRKMFIITHIMTETVVFLPLMMKKIFAMEKGHFIAYMAEKEGIPAHITENIFWSIINGSMAVNKKIGWCKNTDWYELQLQLLRFTMYGLEGLGEVGKRPCVGETGSQE